MRRVPLLVVAVLVCLFLSCSCRPAPAADESRAKLFAMAAEYEAKGMPAEAKVIRDIFPPEKNRQILYHFLPETTSPAGNDRLDETFLADLRRRRDAYSEELYFAAKKQAATSPAVAFQMLHHVLRENPDHVNARQILGHKKSGKSWDTDFSDAPEGRAATVAHPQLGWKARAYFRVISPHFEVVTNSSVNDGKRVAAELEQLYCVWRQMFYNQLAVPGALEARFTGGKEPLFKERKVQHRVVLFKTQKEYFAALKPRLAAIESTTGLYIDLDQQSYLYVADPKDRLAIDARYHEVVHQLLQQELGSDIIPGEQFNFWAVEGIATYFESLARGPGYISLGGWEADRLQGVRYRTLNPHDDRTVPPLPELFAFGKDPWQKHKDVRSLYSRAAGLTQFLLDNGEGKYRQPFLELLAQVYRQEDKLNSLELLTQTNAADLDAQLVKFLQITDDELAHILEPERLRKMVLGHTPVTDAGLAALKVCPNLEWLDVTACNVSDEGLQVISSMPNLKQLFLDGAKGTPASLPAIAKLKNLEELDLSKWPIGDNDLKQLAGLKNLQILFLDNTQITDAGLANLRGLKLKKLETEGTQVTPAGRKRAGFP